MTLPPRKTARVCLRWNLTRSFEGMHAFIHVHDSLFVLSHIIINSLPIKKRPLILLGS